MEDKLTSLSMEKDNINISVQTEIIRCEECKYTAEDMHDLVYHMHGAHPLDNDCIKCDDCWKKFQAKSDLVAHIQNEHNKETKLCNHFL